MLAKHAAVCYEHLHTEQVKAIREKPPIACIVAESLAVACRAFLW